MTRTLSRIAPVHGPVVAEEGWELVGMNPQGKQLYVERTPRSRAVPAFEVNDCVDCDGPQCERCDGAGQTKGKRIYVKNPMTGEPLYPKNEPEFYIHERMFFMDSDGAGNQIKINWSPPTKEQLAADQHARDVADMLPKLASALVNAGLDPEEAAKRLTTPVVEPTPYKAPAPIDPPPFDGSRMMGTEQILTDPPKSEEL
jgi:hypothetical protein